VRRWLLTLPLAAIAFVALAIVDERETFLAAWGFGGPAPTSTAPTAASAEAEAAVRAFNTALERCYAEGSAAPLAGVRVAPDVRHAVEGELAHAASRAAARGLRLQGLSFVQVEPTGESAWSLTTEETWGHPEPGTARSRLRFRYRVVLSAGGPTLEDVTAVLPEPVDAKAR
jgi:hypothetical protein